MAKQELLNLRHSIKQDPTPFFLGLLLAIPCLNYYFNIIIQVGFSGGSTSTPIYILLALIGVYSYARISRYNRAVIIISVTVILCVWATFVIHPSLSPILLSSDLNPLNSALLYIVLYGVPAMIYASTIRDWEIQLYILYLLAIPIVFLSLLAYYLVVFRLRIYQGIEYMTFSYNLLMSFCVCNAYGIIKKNKTAFIIGLLTFIVILIAGARGALVSALIFYILVFLKVFKRNITLGILISIGACLLVFLVSTSFNSILDSVSGVLSKNSASSHTLSMMMDGEFFSTSGRDELVGAIRESLQNNPFGFGMFGDRYVLSRKFGVLSTSSYAHNIFWELSCDFGIILGPLLFVIIAIMLIRSYKIKNVVFVMLFLSLIPNGFLKFFFSSSFLISLDFWALLGLMLNKFISNEK